VHVILLTLELSCLPRKCPRVRGRANKSQCIISYTLGSVRDVSTVEVRGRLACVSITFVTSLSFDSTDIGDWTGDASFIGASLILVS